MRLVYNVYDDENQIESKQFDNFPDALEYAKQGLITYICEEDLDCPGCEERVVWTWDSTWDDEEAIAEVTSGRENVDPFNEVNSFDRANPVSEGPALAEDIEINISGPAEEVRDLASFIFGDEFDLDWDAPIEEVKADEQDFSDEFGYEDEPAVRDLDFDVDDPFEDDLYYSEDEFEDDDELEDEEDFEVGEPEIVEDPDFGPEEEPEEDQPKELEVSKDSEESNSDADDEEIEEDPKKEVDESYMSDKVDKGRLSEGYDWFPDYHYDAENATLNDVEFWDNFLFNVGIRRGVSRRYYAFKDSKRGEFTVKRCKEFVSTHNCKSLEDVENALAWVFKYFGEINVPMHIYDILVDFLPVFIWEQASGIKYKQDGDELIPASEYAEKTPGQLAAGKAIKALQQKGFNDENLFSLVRNYFESELSESAQKSIIDEYKTTYKDIEECLNEGYSADLPRKRAKEIKDELDLHGDIYFDLLEPIDESDEDGWRGASEVRIVDAGSEYEVYFEWLDQDGDYIESDPEFTCGTFEELLGEIDGFYVTVVDLEEYSDSDLDEAIKMTKDELLDKEGTTDVDLINAGRPEEERVELEEGRQPVYSHVIFYYYDENNNEHTITKTNLVPKDIRAEVANLINCGATRVYVDAKIDGEWEPLDKYTYDPEWTPGTPEYAARNGKDFALAVESLDQEDDLTDQEFAEQFKQKLEEIKK